MCVITPQTTKPGPDIEESGLRQRTRLILTGATSLTQDSPSYLLWLLQLRGLAVLNILYAHLWFTPDRQTWIEQLRETVFHGSSLYFFLLSGYLVGYRRGCFQSVKYWRKRLLYVACPYLCLSLVAFLCLNWIHPEILWRDLPHKLFWGQVLPQYWFIPFILALSLATPILVKVPPEKAGWLLALALLPLLGSRTGVELSIHQALYFIPPYLLGYWAGMQPPKALEPSAGRLRVALSLALLSTVWLAAQSPSEALHEGVFYVQKLALASLAYWAFGYRGWRLPLLDILGRFGLAVILLHPILSNGYLQSAYFGLWGPWAALGSFFYPLWMGALSLLLVRIGQAALGPRSRYILGA